MSRIVCFFDDETGQSAICLNQNEQNTYVIDCKNCKTNPFPGKIIPSDRVLRSIIMKTKVPFEYEILSDDEYAQMMAGRVYGRIRRNPNTLHNTSGLNRRNPHRRKFVRR